MMMIIKAFSRPDMNFVTLIVTSRKPRTNLQRNLAILNDLIN